MASDPLRRRAAARRPPRAGSRARPRPRRARPHRLPPRRRERLDEAIARSWNRLVGAGTASDRAAADCPSATTPAPTHPRAMAAAAVLTSSATAGSSSSPRRRGRRQGLRRLLRVQPLPVHLVGAGVAARPAHRRRAAAPPTSHRTASSRSSSTAPTTVCGASSPTGSRCGCCATTSPSPARPSSSSTSKRSSRPRPTSDFALLWLCAHQSRVEAETPEECWLEQWTQAAPARRDACPRRTARRRRGSDRGARSRVPRPSRQCRACTMRSATGPRRRTTTTASCCDWSTGCCSCSSAEDRDAAARPTTARLNGSTREQRYDSYYSHRTPARPVGPSSRRARPRPLRTGQAPVTGWLQTTAQPMLALPPLGSFLWDPDPRLHLSDARLGNDALLEAIRELALRRGRHAVLVDYRNLGAEELGSIYESLLELHPEIDRDQRTFALSTAAGHERKTTGSYYTPTTLITTLLDSALDAAARRGAAAGRPRTRHPCNRRSSIPPVVPGTSSSPPPTASRSGSRPSEPATPNPRRRPCA